MKLSDRIRPDVEAAPWVIEEVKKLEVEHNEALDDVARLQAGLRVLLALTGDPTPERLDRLSEVQGYVRHGEKGCFRAVAERQLAEAVRERDEARAVLRDFAEYDCEYGDNCPSNAGTRHGTCVGCKARQALEKKP